jgi:antitoxin component YwqK of YwqJK toxin-antitoxin module
MKKILLPFLSLILLFGFSSCVSTTQTITSGPENTVMLHWLSSDTEGFVRSTGSDKNASTDAELFTGKAIETFEQSPTKSVSSWKDGKKHGETVEFFYNGRKRRTINYRDGIRHGLSSEYRITGELLQEENYENGKLNGLKAEWHPNGQKIMEITMRNGSPHGEAKEWYLDGTQKSSTIYRHGLREGPASEWYQSGQRKLGLFYQKDKQHGLRTIWYETGQKRLIAQFTDDKMEGNSKGWFPNGQQQFDYNFENNQEHGICTEWDTTGKKISELRFVNGAPVQNLLTGQRIQEEEAIGESNEVINLVNESPVIPVNQEPTPKANNTEKDKPVVEIINKQQTAKPKKKVSNQPPEAKAIPSVQIPPSLDQLPPPPPPVPPAPTPAPAVKPVASPKKPSPDTSNKKEGLNPFTEKATPPAKKTSKGKPASKQPASKAKPNPFENSPPPPIPSETPKPAQAAPPLPPLNELKPFDSPADLGSKPASPQALVVPPSPPTVPPPPLPNGLSPFDAIPPPPSQPKPNPFEKVNSTNTQNSDPFDFAPLPQPPVPTDSADQNASPIPLGNVFNTPPPSTTESEFNPFELPPPSN